MNTCNYLIFFFIFLILARIKNDCILFTVKWGLNIFSENNFRSLPRKVSDAHDARFALLRDECQGKKKIITQ